jgi:predicted PurR-regulated permease PerM
MKKEHILSILVSLVITYLLYLIFSPFFVPLFWAVALVILFYPYYRWLLKITNRGYLSSFIVCVSIALFIMVPLAVMGAALASDFFNAYQKAQNYIKNLAIGSPDQDSIARYIRKYIGEYVTVSGTDIKEVLSNTAKTIASYAAETLTLFIKGLAGFIFNLILSFFAMFFLFKEGEALIGVLKEILPVPDSEKEAIINRTRDVISASIYGGVAVGAVHGLLGGLMFWALGIFAPILWGFSMFIVSFLPVGTIMVWGPAAVYLLVKGHVAKAAVLSVWGMVLIVFTDYILRPAIVSGKTDIHPLLLFFGILGGVTVFGLVGIIAGPLIVCIGLAMIEIYRKYAGVKT